MNRKSAGHKVIAVGAAEVPHAGLTLPNERLTENVEALIPMISAHFIDAKVRQTKQNEWSTFTCFTYVQKPKNKINISHIFSHLFQGGSNMVINSAGPVSSKNQNKRWLLFKRDIVNPAASDVSDQHYSGQSSFFSISFLS